MNSIKIYGAVIVGGGLLFAGSMLDRGMNYVETEAVVTSAEVDCYIKKGRSRIEEKATGEMAYMDCELAPLVAAQYDYKESDIHQRVKFTYKYSSPVDGSAQIGEDTETGSSAAKTYRKGARFKVYAHKEESGKSRLR